MDGKTLMRKLVKPLYAAGGPLGLVDRESFVVERCRGKNVLHVGCADYPLTGELVKDDRLLHTKISAAAGRCLGMDLSEEGLGIMRAHGIKDVVSGDAHRMEDCTSERFEVIVAGEIIEHLSNPGAFLDSALGRLADGGTLVITTANAFFINRLLRLTTGYEHVHYDHCCYYSAKTLSNLARRHGFDVVEIGYAYPSPEGLAGRIIGFPLGLFVGMFNQFGMSLVMTCRKAGEAPRADRLITR